jgi:outer membrane protein assembly factor BamB
MLWQAGITFEEKEPTNALNPYCSASPATDGQHVIACFGSPGLYCYDFDGKEVWHRDLGDIDAMHGSGSSPVIHDGVCFLNFGPGTDSALVACDARTGDVIWKVKPPRSERGFGFRGGFGRPRGFGPSRGGPPRGERRGPDRPGPQDSIEPSAFERASFQGDFSASGGFNGSWSTPVVLRVGDHEELVMAESSRVVAYDPKTGKELWKCGGLPPQIFATPAVGEDFVVVMGHMVPSGTQVMAVKLGGNGDVVETHRLWGFRWSKDIVGSGIVANGCVFLVAENGIAICLDAKTGEKKWEKRLRGTGSRGGSWSSMILNRGKLLVGNHSGEVFVVDASPEFQLIETNSIPDETTCASPAVAHNQVFLRTYKALWCFGDPE